MRLASSMRSMVIGVFCVIMIVLFFRFCVYLNTIIRKINSVRVCYRTVGVFSFGWLIKIIKCWLVRERRFYLTVYGDLFWLTVRKLAR